MTSYAPLYPALLVAALLATTGCRQAEEVDDEAAAREALATSGAPLAVLEKAAQATYDPPADGKLTEAQIEMYLAVKRREQDVRGRAERSFDERRGPSPAGKASGESAGALEDTMEGALALTTADLQAAQELGHNPKEYRWVEERVLEALLAELSGRLRGQLVDGREQYIVMLETQKQAAADPARQAEIDRQIAEIRRQMEAETAAEAPGEAQRHNAALVAKHRARITPVLSPDERFAIGEWEGERPAEPPPGTAPEQP